jgi:hypothetical protein
MGNVNLLSEVYNAISQNEVGRNATAAARNADSILPPLGGSGTSGWTVGFDQEDFNTNSTVSQATLVAALVASGQFNTSNAQLIAKALTNAHTSNVVDFTGIFDVNGNPPSIASIDAALQSPDGANSIAQASMNNITTAYNALASNVFDNSSLASYVQNALADPTQGPLLKIVLADYGNQYGITPGGQMMQLLTTGTATFGGDEVSIDATSASTVTQSVMTAILNTIWVANGNGPQATNRLANDVAAAIQYDEANEITPPSSNITLTSNYGQALISPNSDGTTYSGTWADGSFSGSTTEGGTGTNILDLSGLNSVIDLNGDAVSLNQNASATVNGNTDSIGIGFQNTLTLGGTGNTVTGSGTPSSSTGSTVTVEGPQEQLDYSYTTTVIQTNGSATLSGNNNTSSVGNDGSLTVASGSSNATTVTGNGASVTDNGASDNLIITGSSDTGTLTGNGSSITQWGSSETVTASGTGDGIVSEGNNQNAILTGANDAATLYGSGDSATIWGGNATVSGSGTGEGAVLEGSAQNAILTGGTADANLYGSGDSATIYGTNAVVNGSGTGEGAVLEGSTENAILTGASAGANLHASGDSATIYGNGAAINEQGTGEGAVLEGSAENAYLTVAGAEADVNGSGDTVTASGNNVIITASNTTIDLDGSGVKTSIYGNDDIVNASNGNLIYEYGNGNATYGSADIVDGEGTDDYTYGEDDTDEGEEDDGGDGGDGGDAIVAGGGSSKHTTITVANGQTSSVATSGNALNVGDNASLTLGAGGAANTVNLSGKGSTVIDNGEFDVFTVSGASNAVNISANALNSTVAGDVTTLSALNEQITFSRTQSVIIKNGVKATIVGSDGTVTASNTSSGAKNVINWYAGGSEVQSITTLSGGSILEDDTGYTGSNGTGTVSNTQITTTQSGGAISSTISGQGDISGLNSASITLAANASAHLTGNGNAVTLGNNDTLAITGGYSDAVTVSGKNAVVTDDNTSNTDSFVLNGTNDTVTISGGNDTLTVGGSSNSAKLVSGVLTGTATLSGVNANLEIAGASDETILFSKDATGTLKLDFGSGFGGTLAGLASGDSVDLANLQYSGTPTVSSVTGTGATGSYTDVTITDGSAHVMLALLNQYTAQYAVSSSAYTLTADGTGGSAGTLFQLAAGH